MIEINWPFLILSMIKAKERLSKVDDGLWPYTFPKVRASKEQVRLVEERLGARLPTSYRTFLLHANGWSAFFQTIDLLSCEELLGGHHQDYARTMLSGLTEADWANLGLTLDELLVIGVTLDDRDILAINLVRASGEGDNYVVWIAGEIVDEWPSFDECFKSMIAYVNRAAKKREK